MDERAIVLLISLSAAFITWKLIKDFYSKNLHNLFAHIIAIITATFMFLATMILFVPKNYEKGVTPEVEFSFASFASVFTMVVILYILFKVLPSRKKKNVKSF